MPAVFGKNVEMTESAASDTAVGDNAGHYASQDPAIAIALAENLEQHAIKCWIAPRDVTPGSQYADEIVAAIMAPKCLCGAF